MSIIITASILSVICATIAAVVLMSRTDSTETAAPVEDTAQFPGTTPIAGTMAMRWAREAADNGDIKQAEIYRELAVSMGAERTGYNFWGDRI